MTPTTDEMDQTTPEERNKLAAMCARCGAWKHFTRRTVIDNENALRVDERPTAGQQCSACGSHDFVIQSVISQRTWDVERAKKETAKLKRKLLKR